MWKGRSFGVDKPPEELLEEVTVFLNSEDITPTSIQVFRVDNVLHVLYLVEEYGATPL